MLNQSPWLKVLLQKRMLLILTLGFASGLPLGLTGTTLQAWYAMDGVSIVTIGFLGLVGQPYVYKFLWAPLMDKWQLPFLGRRRGWMLVTQIGLVTTLVLMAFSSPVEEPYFLGFMALCVAFLSASQDIAIDAYRTELLTVEERGLGTSMAVTGYRVAMLFSTALTLVMADSIGFSPTYLIMALIMGVVGIFSTVYAKEPLKYRDKSPSFVQSCIEPFKEFLTRRHAILLLSFIILYKLGDAFAGNLTTVFLLKGVGFSLKEVGFSNKTIGLIATLLGTFSGGVLMIKLGLYRALFVFGIIQALTNLLFLMLALVGQHLGMMIATIFLENFAGGLGTAAYMALIMSLCSHQFTATQFALLSSLAAMGRVFVGPIAGILVDKFGWIEFFIWTVVFAMPGLILLYWLRETIEDYSVAQEKDLISSPSSEVKEAKEAKVGV